MDERRDTTGKRESSPATTPASRAASPAFSLTGMTNQRGLECPRCGCRHFHVLYTRAAIGGRILRRRECRHCGGRVTTYEQVA